MLLTIRWIPLPREVESGKCPAALFSAPLANCCSPACGSMCQCTGTVLPRDCHPQCPAHCVGVTDHARQCVLLAKGRSLAGETEGRELPAATLLAPLGLRVDLHS